MTGEDSYIKNIENGLRAMRLGTKTPVESKIGYNLNKLKLLNIGMYEDYLKRYKEALEIYKNKLG